MLKYFISLLVLISFSAQAKEELFIYNWSDYIAISKFARHFYWFNFFCVVYFLSFNEKNNLLAAAFLRSHI